MEANSTDGRKGKQLTPTLPPLRPPPRGKNKLSISAFQRLLKNGPNCGKVDNLGVVHSEAFCSRFAEMMHDKPLMP